MRKALLLIVALVIVATGAGKANATNTCTDWLPTRSTCVGPECPTFCATVYNDVGWYSSSSYAFRHSVHIDFYNPGENNCLGPNETISLAYVKTNGAWKASWVSPKGWCGGDSGIGDSGGAQVKIQLALNGNGAPSDTELMQLVASSVWS